MEIKLLLGDCLEKLKELSDNSVDSLVTDPPAGISFMGKSWDDDKGGRDHWISWLSEVMRECNRVLKPGGHGLVWSIPRTSHWTALALEDAGFEIRDVVSHIFGSGFPKSLDISKAIDKKFGAEREVVGIKTYPTQPNGRSNIKQGYAPGMTEGTAVGNFISNPSTDQAKQWSGFGTALKPACEFWWLVRKPISENTIVDNVLRWGTGGINVDGCRISLRNGEQTHGSGSVHNSETTYTMGRFSSLVERKGLPNLKSSQGRFPAHLIHDGSEEVLAGFPNNTGANGTKEGKYQASNNVNFGGGYVAEQQRDKGSAARFFKKCQLNNQDHICNNINAYNVAKFFIIFLATTESTAITDVEDLEKEQLGQVVKSAGIECGLCEILIVQGLVKVKSLVSRNEGLAVSLDSIGNFKNSILKQNLVLVVEEWVNTGTIPTTQSLLTLFGSVLLATVENINLVEKEKVVVGNDQVLETNSRIKYTAKASKRDRDEGLPEGVRSSHPTVKATSLMRYLCKLITPPGGTVLDPFMGSGSTGKAAKLEGFNFIGIEKELEYFEIAKARIENAQESGENPDQLSLV